jgi:hypothetical protein
VTDELPHGTDLGGIDAADVEATRPFDLAQGRAPGEVVSSYQAVRVFLMNASQSLAAC